MADPHTFDFIRIPAQTLIALDWRPYHFALQRYHHLVRLAHILSVSLFFGGIALLDLRLIGVRGTLPLRQFADHTLPWLWVTFGIAMATGVALFFYDPVHVGAHAYFTGKLALIGFGLLNALVFHRVGYCRRWRRRGAPSAVRAAQGRCLCCSGLASWSAPVLTSRRSRRCSCDDPEAGWARRKQTVDLARPIGRNETKARIALVSLGVGIGLDQPTVR